MGEVFNILLIDIYEDDHYSDSGLSEYFFTIVESLLTELTVLITTACTLIDTLNSLTLIYQITSKTPTSELTELILEDTYTFITSDISRYNSHYFYRVVINTGVSKYSTTGFRQFQAL